MKYMRNIHTHSTLRSRGKIRNFYHAIDMFLEMNLLLMYKAYLSLESKRTLSLIDSRVSPLFFLFPSPLQQKKRKEYFIMKKRRKLVVYC
jgi:hypothetical protein